MRPKKPRHPAINDHKIKSFVLIAIALVVVCAVSFFAIKSGSQTKNAGLEVDLRESGNGTRSPSGNEATKPSDSSDKSGSSLQEGKKSEKVETSDKTDKAEKTDKSEAGKEEKRDSEKKEKTEKSEKSEKTEKTEKSEKSEQGEAAQAVKGIKTVLSDSGIEMVYQTAEKARGKTSRAILFLAHGCSHSATDFFDKSDDCKECIGLPIERKIVSAALDKSLSVIAVTSRDRESKCWNPQDDVERIKKAVDSFRKTNNLDKLPLVALGASSGGAIVHALGTSAEPPAAIAVQIMPVPPEHITDKYPPAIFWHMPKDKRGAPVIAEDLNALKSRKRPVKELTCNPKPIGEDFFSSMIPEVSKQTSAKIVQIFKKKNIIDDKSMLVDDPRRTEWRKELQEVEEVASGKLSLTADASGISELMNVAWAQHEFCDEGLDEALSFLISHAVNSA